MIINPFVDSQRRLRQGWWIAVFFLVLGAILAPLLVMTRREGTQVSVMEQAVVVTIASLVCQLMRRRPIAELVGALNRRWPQQFFIGAIIGVSFMSIPALYLGACRYIAWQESNASLKAVGAAVALFAAVAVTEELVFRGFIFQRLIEGLGNWPSQLILGAYFVLTHSGTLPAGGVTRCLAITNIFIASLLFGLAFIRTKSLAMPLGMHFAVNVTQGCILGFGVSGTSQAGTLLPINISGPDWMTGGQFGLEASLPGLVAVISAAVILHQWRRSESTVHA
jgi:membrane protease YdiL (CAAX protease family)